ncbi:RNA methyltransferase [candidate division WWE3 bacterium]|uniref:RNA methyltransferase n=1 Tax=candidate division WWE3 bacterium TaxID=2053526 RepID=A0A955LVP6_UNCKA|nr:RNA methyltransferase [candidate division WWE3 bacterium]
MDITSRNNPRIKDIAKLQSKKHRDRQHKFLIEGYYPLSYALDNNYPIEEIFVCEKLLRNKFDNNTLLERIKKSTIQITTVSEDVYAKLSNYESPEGLIAVAPEKDSSLSNLNPQNNGLYLVAESIEKLSSLGTLFRLADNAGVDAVILCDPQADMYNPHVIRTSLGTFFSVTIVEATTDKTITWCKENNIQTLATSPQAKKEHTQVDMTPSTAIVIGTEHGGLSEKWLQQADIKVLIPMYGKAESLSVSTSAAIMLYEAIRQRHN